MSVLQSLVNRFDFDATIGYIEHCFFSRFDKWPLNWMHWFID